jgi:hypothetical protein
MSNLEDGLRAERSPFQVSLDLLNNIMQKQDLELLQKSGGVEGLLKGLNSDPQKGITESSMEERTKQYPDFG